MEAFSATLQKNPEKKICPFLENEDFFLSKFADLRKKMLI